MKANNNPIRLSGRVFVDKVLAVKLPYYSLDRVSELREGDIKLIAVPSQKDHGYQGFIRAWIWQSSGKGGSWRNLAIREKAGTEAIYHGDVLMKEKAREVMNHMAALAGITATKREKQRYYFVRYDSSRVVPTYNPPAQAKPAPVAPVTEKANPAPITANAAVVDKTVTVNAAADGTTVVNVAVSVQVVARPQETAAPARTASGLVASRGKGKKGKKEDPNQGRLFD